MTGKKRQRRQPLAIDQLPQEVRDRIVKLRAEGKGWEQIEEMSAEFAGRRLGHSSLHRWYDIRVEQALAGAIAERQWAQKWVDAFAAGGSDVPQLLGAVRNALGEQVFLLKQAAEGGNTAEFRQALGDLGTLLARFRQLDIEEQRLAQKNKELELKLDEMKQKAQRAAKQIEKVAGAGASADLKKLAETVRGIYGA